MFINSGCLFGIAKQAYERTKAAARHDRSDESNQPLISIVFAAAAGEAFINEIRELASQPSERPEPRREAPSPEEAPAVSGRMGG